MDHPIKMQQATRTVVNGVSYENVSMLAIARWHDSRIIEDYAFIRNQIKWIR